MKLFFAAVVVLALVHSAQGLLFGAIFAVCVLSALFRNPWCWGGRGGGGGGGGGPSVPAPPAPCPAGYWRPAGGQCQSVIASCTAPLIEVMHPNRPCGCQPAGATFDPLIKYCNSPPPNATMYCETAANGASSQCKVSCTPPDMKYNPAINRCIRDKLTGCTPPEELAAGPRNEGCVCLASSDPDDGPLGEKCGYVPYNPGEQALGYPPPGRMVCIIDPADITNSKCIKDCLPQYKESGLRKCVPKGP